MLRSRLMLKILCTFGLFSISFLRAESMVYDIKLELNLACPYSEELLNLADTIDNDMDTEMYEEWRDSCLISLIRLIDLIESGKIYSAEWNMGICSNHED